MQIDSNSWHYKIYVFNTQLCRAWVGDKFFYEVPELTRIGLCPYMRMILIWGPLVMLTYIIPLGMVLLAFLWVPFVVISWQASVIFFSSTLGGVIGFIAILMLLSEFGKYRRNKMSKNRQDELDRKYKNLPEPDSFSKVLKEYITSFKTKICPVIEVRKNEK